MSAQQDLDPELLRGLTTLVASTIPKQCRCCGKTFADVDDYVRETARPANGSLGLKQSIGDAGEVIVDLFRNCPCGSTLMDSFNDRRDNTSQGSQRREQFSSLLIYLTEHGLEPTLARQELLHILQSGQSEILAHFRPSAAKK